MALLGDGPIVDTNKNDKNIPELEKFSFVLLHCNVVHNDHLQNSKLLHSFVPNNTFGRLLFVQSPELIRTRATDSVFDYAEIWFTDQDNNPLQIEDKVNVSLLIQNRLYTRDDQYFT